VERGPHSRAANNFYVPANQASPFLHSKKPQGSSAEFLAGCNAAPVVGDRQRENSVLFFLHRNADLGSLGMA
jgi:hypothetical protein